MKITTLAVTLIGALALSACSNNGTMSASDSSMKDDCVVSGVDVAPNQKTTGAPSDC